MDVFLHKYTTDGLIQFLRTFYPNGADVQEYMNSMKISPDKQFIAMAIKQMVSAYTVATVNYEMLFLKLDLDGDIIQ